MGDIVKVRRKLEWLKLLGCTKAGIKSVLKS